MKELRDKVIEGFRPDDGYTYSHVLPFAYTNFIDGMAWVGTLAGACKLVQDKELVDICECYLNNLILVGKDARNFAPTEKSPSSWDISNRMVGYSYKKKPQSFAGPCGLQFAINCGCDIDRQWVHDINLKAKLFCLIATPFGYLIRWVKSLRQHLNSIMFAHMVLDKKPPKSMHFLSKNNPIYSWVFREKCDSIYPNTGIWPAKDWPYGDRVEKIQQYSPICNLTGIYLQRTL